MTILAVSEKYLVVSKGLRLDLFDFTNHTVIDVPIKDNSEVDSIADVTISPDGKRLAIITTASKGLHVFNLPDLSTPHTYSLPRSASKIRFTPNNKSILVADKSGDALIYDIEKEDRENKLLGHLSLLLDILQTPDEKFIITSDRDEKIRVTSYPNTYNIQTYCLGHTEFVKHIELLPHDSKYLLSSSGDGFIKIWDHFSGKLQHSIDTNCDISESNLKEEFIKAMDVDGHQVNALPIILFTVTKQNSSSSLIATMVHNSKQVLVYLVESLAGKFQHTLKDTIKLNSSPDDIKFYQDSLHIYNSSESNVTVFRANDHNLYKPDREYKMFTDQVSEKIQLCNNLEQIKLLYKRKYDNVQEYQERKKQRLENSITK